ncbi:MAG: hypothetical protein ABI611_19810 [Solirubrobacteraceae bacterium]
MDGVKEGDFTMVFGFPGRARSHESGSAASAARCSSRSYSR